MTKILVYIVKSRGESYPANNHGFRTEHNDYEPSQYEAISKDAARHEYTKNKGSFEDEPLEIEVYNSSSNSVGCFVVDVARLPGFWVTTIQKGA